MIFPRQIAVDIPVITTSTQMKDGRSMDGICLMVWNFDLHVFFDNQTSSKLAKHEYTETLAKDCL